MNLRQGPSPQYGNDFEKLNLYHGPGPKYEHVSNKYETAPRRRPKVWKQHGTNMKLRQGAGPKYGHNIEQII